MQERATAPAVDMTARDRHMRRRMHDATPSERLAAMRLLIERSWAMLQHNPTGLAHFRRRTVKARAISSSGGPMSHGT